MKSGGILVELLIWVSQFLLRPIPLHAQNFCAIILILVIGKKQAYGLLFSVELLETKAVNYVLIGPIPLQPKIFSKTIKLMLNLQWQYYDRLYSGVGSDPSEKKYPLA